MSHSIVIAQVGTGKYKNTKYVHEDKMPSGETVIDDPDSLGTESNYSFEAVMEEILSQKPDQVDLILAATEDSYLGALYDVFSTPMPLQTEQSVVDITQDTLPEGVSCIEDLFEIAKPTDEKEPEKTKKVKRINETEVKSAYEQSLSKNMQTHFDTAIPISVKLAIIENGENTEQLQNNFSSIQEVLDNVMENKNDHWDISFDITNGFRSFPIYIYTLINYLQKFRTNVLSKDNSIQYHMYYGMYEASKKFPTKSSSEEENVESVAVTPLVDLQVIDELLQWINAISEFQYCGSVKQILKILDKHPQWDIKIGINDKETLSYAFEMFDYGTNSNNLAAIELGINLLTQVGDKIYETEQHNDAEQMNDAEKLLLKSISEDFSMRFGTESTRAEKPYMYSFLLIQLAKWFHEMGREGNAAIAVQEMLPTYLMERYPDQLKKFLLIMSMIESGNKYDRECDFREACYLFDYDIRQPIKNHLEYLLLADDKKNRKIFTRYKKIKENVRDIMAHIALTEGEDVNYKAYNSTIKDQIDFFLKEIASAEDAASGAKDLSSGDILVNCLFTGVRNEDKNAEKLLKKQTNQLKNTFKDPNLGYDEFFRQWDEWGFLEDWNLLKPYMCRWASLDPQMTDEDLKQYLYDKCNETKNGKPGYEDLMEYLDANRD